MRRGGFTLIEVMSVVAIIGILAAVTVGSLGAVQKRQRDHQRKADLHLIAQAIDLYYAETRRLPQNSANKARPCDQLTDSDLPGVDFWIQELGPAYLTGVRGAKKLPRDPLAGRRDDFVYTYQCSETEGTSYILTARLENRRDPEASGGIYRLIR